ncbi:hypothetical protein B879_03788 [Cecembia lonarensis LW9]|uniref:Uncharacterized protein n=1 Tax=Cecembia lonarensis (strain CCUG 58316 / KCTC 22772 / LW9) TaxID=1225176 RepID=K1LTY6_CECL9|nr:hypothetical protein B879_03788 [Cecembia lonarensis LW9]
MICQIEALRFGYMNFDSDTCSNKKKEAIPNYETAYCNPNYSCRYQLATLRFLGVNFSPYAMF